MRTKYALITICRDEIAPRFDMTAEVVLTRFSGDMAEQTAENSGGNVEAGLGSDDKHLVLARVSSEELCDLITGSGVSVVVCGGIEENYYHYLRWKRIEVISDVMGKVADVLPRLVAGNLQSGDCLYPQVLEDLT